MKKLILSMAMLAMAVSSYAAGKFEVKDFGSFKLHSYITGDPLGDINYIIEGEKSVVIVEPAAFFDNIKELNTYIEKLGKPVEKVISDYHLAGFTGHDISKFVMIEGMTEFAKGPVYGSMMNHFADVFKGKMDVGEHANTATVAKTATEKWAGIDFSFAPGVASDFPAASIIIGKKVYYTHFTPAKAHPSPLQIYSRDAVNAVLAELEKVKASGCKVIIGGHGMATTDITTVEFEIIYLRKIKEILSKETSKDSFIAAIQKAYPGLAGEDNLKTIATNLYK